MQKWLNYETDVFYKARYIYKTSYLFKYEKIYDIEIYIKNEPIQFFLMGRTKYPHELCDYLERFEPTLFIPMDSY